MAWVPRAHREVSKALPDVYLLNYKRRRLVRAPATQFYILYRMASRLLQLSTALSPAFARVIHKRRHEYRLIQIQRRVPPRVWEINSLTRAHDALQHVAVRPQSHSLARPRVRRYVWIELRRRLWRR